MNRDINDFLRIIKILQTINPEFPLQYVICLIHIARNEGLSMTELADETGMALSTTSRITSALAKKGGAYELIRVDIAPDEKRRKKIFLSENGKTLLNDISTPFSDCTPRQTVL